MEDVHRAGGIPAILKEIQAGTGRLHLDRITVTGKTLGESIAGGRDQGRRGHPAASTTPTRQHGGLAILFGNLAPERRGGQDRRRAAQPCASSAARPRILRIAGRRPWRASWPAR